MKNVNFEALIGDLWNNKCLHKDHSVWLDCGDCVTMVLRHCFRAGRFDEAHRNGYELEAADFDDDTP